MTTPSNPADPVEARRRLVQDNPGAPAEPVLPEDGAGYAEIGDAGDIESHPPAVTDPAPSGPWVASTRTPPDQDDESGSTASVVKDEASNVKDRAVAAGADVAETAKDRAQDVASEAGAQAKSLAHQLRSEVGDQAHTQLSRAADSLHALSKELGTMAAKSDQQGPMTDLVQQASHKGGELAHWLQDREPEDVLDEVKSFARRRPFAFLGLCFAAGVVAGRVTRGAVAANTSLDSPDGSDGPNGPRSLMPEVEDAGPDYVDPRPAVTASVVDVPEPGDQVTGVGSFAESYPRGQGRP